MSAWDNNNWGGSFTPSNDYSDGNGSVEETPATVADDTVEENVDATVEDTSAVDDGDNATDNANDSDGKEHDGSDDGEGKSKRKTREARPSNKVPHLNEKVAEKVIALVDTLRNNAQAVEVAKLMTGSRKSEPAALVAELTDGRNRAHINEVADIAKQLEGVDESTLMAKLIMVFASGKNNVETVFAVLNAVAPDRNFGRVNKPSQDKWMQYAQTIHDHWGDGVDVSMVENLKVV